MTQGQAGEPEEVHPLPYSGIASVDTENRRLLVTTTEGVEWRVPFPDDPKMAPVLKHLRWVGQVRGHVLSIRNDIELAAGEITNAAFSLDWEQAREAYERARSKLDEAVLAVQLVEPVATEHLAPEVTEIERTLERAHTRLYIERGKSALSLGQHLVENGEHDRARETLREATEYYERASDQSDVIKRGDAFQFGPQRELQDELETLSWELETVAAEPLRQAHEAKIQAQSATDRQTKVDHWERALQRYGDVLTLQLDEHTAPVTEDPANLRAQRETAAERILDIREQLARETWDTGSKHHQQGDNTAALEHCLDAVEQLERVSELSESFDVGDSAEIEQRLEQMHQVVRQLREGVDEFVFTSPDDEQEQPTEEADDDPDTTQQSESESIPSVSELAAIDTHHEITLEIDEDESESETTTDDAEKHRPSGSNSSQ